MRLYVNLPGPFSVGFGGRRHRKSVQFRDIKRPHVSETTKQTLTNRQLAKQYRKDKILH
jgi:hypothetical protein